MSFRTQVINQHSAVISWSFCKNPFIHPRIEPTTYVHKSTDGQPPDYHVLRRSHIRYPILTSYRTHTEVHFRLHLGSTDTASVVSREVEQVIVADLHKDKHPQNLLQSSPQLWASQLHRQAHARVISSSKVPVSLQEQIEAMHSFHNAGTLPCIHVASELGGCGQPSKLQ